MVNIELPTPPPWFSRSHTRISESHTSPDCSSHGAREPPSVQGTLKPVPDLTSHCNELTVWALHSQRMATHVTGTILQHRPLPPVTCECKGGMFTREEGGEETKEGGTERALRGTCICSSGIE